jgi:hypothetical protein
MNLIRSILEKYRNPSENCIHITNDEINSKLKYNLSKMWKYLNYDPESKCIICDYCGIFYENEDKIITLYNGTTYCSTCSIHLEYFQCDYCKNNFLNTCRFSTPDNPNSQYCADCCMRLIKKHFIDKRTEECKQIKYYNGLSYTKLVNIYKPYGSRK